MNKNNTIHVEDDFLTAIKNDNVVIVNKYLNLIEGKKGSIQIKVSRSNSDYNCYEKFLIGFMVNAVEFNSKDCIKCMADHLFKVKCLNITLDNANKIAGSIEEDSLLYLIELGLWDLDSSFIMSTIVSSLYFDNPDYIQALLNHNLIDFKDDKYKGILSDAVASDINAEYINLLLDLGADVNEKVPKHKNLTPLEIARRDGYQDIVDCINQWVDNITINVNKKTQKEIKDNSFYIQKIKQIKPNKIKGFIKKGIK